MKSIILVSVLVLLAVASAEETLSLGAYSTTYAAGSYVFSTNVVPSTLKDYAATLRIKAVGSGDITAWVYDWNSAGNWNEARFNQTALAVSSPIAMYLTIPGHYWVNKYSGSLTSYTLKFMVTTTGDFQAGFWKVAPLESSIYLSVNGSYASQAAFELDDIVQGPAYLSLGLHMEQFVGSHYMQATIQNYGTSGKYDVAYLHNPKGVYSLPGSDSIGSLTTKAVVTSCWTKWKCTLENDATFFVEMHVKKDAVVSSSISAFTVDFKAIESDSAFTVTLSFALMAVLVIASLL